MCVSGVCDAYFKGRAAPSFIVLLSSLFAKLRLFKHNTRRVPLPIEGRDHFSSLNKYIYITEEAGVVEGAAADAAPSPRGDESLTDQDGRPADVSIDHSLRWLLFAVAWAPLCV